MKSAKALSGAKLTKNPWLAKMTNTYLNCSMKDWWVKKKKLVSLYCLKVIINFRFMYLQVKVTGYYVLGWRLHQFITNLCTRYLVHIWFFSLVQLPKCMYWCCICYNPKRKLWVAVKRWTSLKMQMLDFYCHMLK